MRRRIAMAAEAPLHFERGDALNARHAVDAPVALDAADAFRQMDAVVEVDEVGQVVHANPAQRSPGARALTQRREQRRIAEELRMAAQADFGRRNAGEGGFLDRPVAVATIDAVIADVVLVTEGNRLRRRQQPAVRRQRLIGGEPRRDDQGNDVAGGDQGIAGVDIGGEATRDAAHPVAPGRRH